MYLIVGLGNIGKEYDKTRHNIGFDAINLLSKEYNIPLNRKKFKGTCGEGFIGSEKVLLIKPETYMNCSGESVIEAVNFYKIANDKIIIIYDDISLNVGRMRIRTKGSAGGHNGIKSIIAHLNSDEFNRVKIGVGSPKGELVSHVLGRFSKEHREVIEKVLGIASKAVECMVKEGTVEAMNKFNSVSLED
ncbi:aminoacyl-tRNA hydrolase [Haloimpatiens sp. FM7315]|uniref:aminoacyl-tRNA hydrolase n=1 Tax=Haloimpatiens sp. FM7315 TaxID=3298609 RepID=UPI0035A2AFFA